VAVSNYEIFRTYLERFTGGDVEGAAELLADEFAFDGPILQAKDKAEFLAGSTAAAAMARGCTIHHQWVDGRQRVLDLRLRDRGPPSAPAPSRWPSGP